MMDTIKFRARDKNGNWNYGVMSLNAIADGQNGFAMNMECFFADINNGHLDIKTLTQYTGLKDKNGKEIYEGDEIEWALNYSKGSGTVSMIMTWSAESGYYPRINPTSEVIGNIYENPELKEATNA